MMIFSYTSVSAMDRRWLIEVQIDTNGARRVLNRQRLNRTYRVIRHRARPRVTYISSSETDDENQQHQQQQQLDQQQQPQQQLDRQQQRQNREHQQPDRQHEQRERVFPRIPLEMQNNEPINPINIICAICLETPRRPVATLCGHIFCLQCLISARQRNDSCPVCRKYIFASFVHPLFFN